MYYQIIERFLQCRPGHQEYYPRSRSRHLVDINSSRSRISRPEPEGPRHSELMNNAPKTGIAPKRVQNLELHASPELDPEVGRCAALDLAEHRIGLGTLVFTAS